MITRIIKNIDPRHGMKRSVSKIGIAIEFIATDFRMFLGLSDEKMSTVNS